MDREQEVAFVRAFIVPDKQERYTQLLESPKRRAKILGVLFHSLDVAPRYSFSIANGDHSPEAVERLLRRKGAGVGCYLISPESDLDQREMPLREAITRLISSDGVAVVCCVPGRLAYYKAEL